MIEPYAGIERNPRGEILAEVDISGHFIYGLVGKLRALVAAHGLVNRCEYSKPDLGCYSVLSEHVTYLFLI